MKKSVSLLLAGAMCAGLLAGCSSSSTSGGASAAASGSTAPSSVVSGEAGSKSIEKLSIAFVPSREPEEIITATEPLKEMLTAELAGLGYDVGEVEITVGTSYEAVGEALSAGTADVGLIPGGTYVLYDDGCDVLLTATRDGLSIDSDQSAKALEQWEMTKTGPPPQPRPGPDPTETEVTQLPRSDDRRPVRKGTGACRQGQRRRGSHLGGM